MEGGYPMSEENKAVIRRLTEEFDKKNFAIVEELSTPSAIFHYPGNEPWDREAQQGFYKAFSAAFPDHQHTIEEQIAEGDKVVTRWTIRGTHNGDLQGIAPTGRQVTIDATVINHMVGGKIQVHRVFYDMLGVMQRIGAIPSQ